MNIQVICQVVTLLNQVGIVFDSCQVRVVGPLFIFNDLGLISAQWQCCIVSDHSMILG